MDSIIFHIDANSAFLSWQATYDLQHGATLDIREVPAVIGGNQATRHGIVLAKSIFCKPYKIQTGEPILTAKQKCPNLIVVSPNYFIYMQSSKAMFDLLKEYFSDLQKFSIDEGFMQFNGMESILGKDPVEAATIIKERIKKELGFTVSVGIGNNKLLAKMASEFKKPDGVSTCYQNEIKEKMWPLPVRELYGVGQATEEKLHKYDIYTIGELANTPIEFLRLVFKSYGKLLWQFSNGIENSAIHQGHSAGNHHTIKGVGNSCTSHWDVTDRKDAYLNLLSLTETIAMRLRFGGYAARVISVSVRKDDLISYSHQRKLLTPLDTVEGIYSVVKSIFDEMWKGEPIRGFAIRATDLYSEFSQMNFFEKDWSKQKDVNRAIDSIRLKYGSDSIMRGVFLNSGINHMQGGMITEDYPQMSSIL